MPPEDSSYAADWLRIAQKDLERVQGLLGLGDPEAAAFYLQQGLEKLLKAFLVARGWHLQRTHDLEVLLNEALHHEAGLETYRAALQRVSAFYFVERYPIRPGIALTSDEVESMRDAVSGLIGTLRRGLD